MKKILVLLVLCCFSACSAGPSPEELLQKTQERLAQGCEVSQELRGESEASATLRWSAGEQELCFTAPDAVEGLCYLRDGGGLTVTFEGISSKISEAALPQGAAAAEIFEAFDTLCGATPLSVSPHPSADADTFPPRGRLELQSDLLLFEQEGHSVWIDTESCLPIAVETEHWAVALALHNAL